MTLQATLVRAMTVQDTCVAHVIMLRIGYTQGIVCETCSQWYRIDCQNIHNNTYDLLNNSMISWNCSNLRKLEL